MNKGICDGFNGFIDEWANERPNMISFVNEIKRAVSVVFDTLYTQFDEYSCCADDEEIEFIFKGVPRDFTLKVYDALFNAGFKTIYGVSDTHFNVYGLPLCIKLCFIGDYDWYSWW